jgi:hypothetical protein
MPRRKELRGVASGLLGAFLSRTNDVEGYWALGKLYAHALKADVPQVFVDLMDATVTPPGAEFHGMAADFARALTIQLAGRSIPADWVKQATICIEFSKKKNSYGPGDVFNGTVALMDDRGRTHHAKASGVCWVHDPFRELRSARTWSDGGYFRP